MKKLLTGFIIILAATACRQKNTAQADMAQKTDSVETILNGLTRDESSEMIRNFLQFRCVDNTPDTVNIWYSRQEFNAMMDMLKADSAGPYKPDGIRLYFLTVQKPASAKERLNNNLAWVSTYATTDEKGQTVHSDYFTHSSLPKNLPLGKLWGQKSINNTADTSTGALLYQDNKTESNCTLSTNNDISVAEAEQMVQFFGKSFIKTTSEWFPLSVFDGLYKELSLGKDDGIRVYFAKRYKQDTETYGYEAFVITTTRPEKNPAIHSDYFDCDKAKSLKNPPQDNGEICPTKCNGTAQP